jgi:hypothetical protein
MRIWLQNCCNNQPVLLRSCREYHLTVDGAQQKAAQITGRLPAVMSWLSFADPFAAPFGSAQGHGLHMRASRHHEQGGG